MPEVADRATKGFVQFTEVVEAAVQQDVEVVEVTKGTLNNKQKRPKNNEQKMQWEWWRGWPAGQLDIPSCNRTKCDM